MISSLLRRIGNFIGTRGWTYPPLISQRDSAKLGVITNDPEAYFAERRDGRRWLVDAILAGFVSRPFSLCSIGSGYGGEESLLQPATDRMVLIEPDERQNEFLHRKFPPGVQIEQSFFQFCHFETPFDVVYASGLSYWMNRDPLEGINPDLLVFLQRNLKPGGLGIFLIYGGNHSGLILDQTCYLKRLVDTARQAGLHVLLYGKFQPKAAMLVVSTEVQDLGRFAHRLTEICVQNDRTIGGRRAGFSAYLYTLIIAVHVMMISLRKILADAAASFRQVARLRADSPEKS